MPSFKPKTSKVLKINRKYTTTLDGMHNQYLNEFEMNDLNVIPELKKERHYLKKRLEKENVPIQLSLEIQDRIREINDSIRTMQYKKQNYFLDNSKYIFEYFENKKNIGNVEESSSHASTNKSQLLFQIFKMKQEEPPNEMEHQNKNIVNRYLSNVDESFIDMKNYMRETDLCPVCCKGEMVPLEDEGLLICNECANNIPYLIENDKPSYKEPPKEVSSDGYKRINHFKEIMAQFQGKETTQLPDGVIDQIQLQIKKERIQLHQLSHQKLKEILKKLNFNKAYEHIPFIQNKLGIQVLVFSPELEETLCNLFIDIQSPYARACPDDRVNFLNYYYVLYKFLELLGETQYLKFIPLLKDRQKLFEADQIWKKMVRDPELNWEFISTL
jgi:hypothetical protein